MSCLRLPILPSPKSATSVKRQARLLKEAFGIETVSDLGTHPLFDVARAIVMLAESEG